MTLSLKDRQDKILQILRFLQEDGDFDQAKSMFQTAFDEVSVKEITEAERALIAGGLNPQEIQNLCTVHAEVFRGAIGEKEELPAFEKPGHPVHTLKQENLVLTSLVNDALLPDLDKFLAGKKEKLAAIRQELADLSQIHKHYTRKEISMFPLMTKYGITAPPQVMWGVDDDIRRWIKEAKDEAGKERPDPDLLAQKIKQAAKEVTEMIFKEEAIMIPLLADVASPLDWQAVKEDEGQVGYCLINPPVNWKPAAKEIADFKQNPESIAKWNAQVDLFAQNLGGNEKENYDRQVAVAEGEKANEAGGEKDNQLSSIFVDFAQGRLRVDQLRAMFSVMPFDIAFVDDTDTIRFFGGNCGFYPHSKNDLGMNLFSIHMPKSVSKVKQIVDDLRTGKKDKHEFWFEIRGRFVYIQYIAVRSKGKYLGVLEVLQDATYVRSLKGGKKDL